jgi:NADPH-dependent 2,4-dienoyl-CoA reductase/sulfur reductase-like enzyme
MNRIADVSALAESYDLVVIGAGPAGMQAAITASAHGAQALVVDENATPGGQIYRAVTTTPVRDKAILGESYWAGEAICTAFAGADIGYAAGATIWSIGEMGANAPGLAEIGVSMRGQARILTARHIVLATGAIERPFAVPGWTLPGVMTAGAAQIALKASGLVPQGRVVLAGSGPLLYLLASQLRAAGADIVAVADTTPKGSWQSALPHLPDFLLSPYLGKGLKLLLEVRRSLRFLGGVTSLRIEGTDRASRVLVGQGPAQTTLDCDLVLLHHGVIPNINMANAIGCAQHFDEIQHCWTPRVDDWFTTSLPHIALAGDGAGIGGAESAALRGTLAGLEAARILGRITAETRDREAAPIRRELALAMRGRRFLDLLYRPARAFLAPRDPQTIACRCEEVTVGQIRDTTRNLHVLGPNQMKAFLRCGMGPCQGRLCGPTVTEIMAETRGVTMAEIGTYRLRPPFTEAAVKAVIRS